MSADMPKDNASQRLIANDKGSVIFPCPAHPEERIVRSENARQIGATYVCPKCEFEGPN